MKNLILGIFILFTTAITNASSIVIDVPTQLLADLNTNDSQIRKDVIEQKELRCFRASCRWDIENKVFGKEDLLSVIAVGDSWEDQCPKQICNPQTIGSDDFIAVIANHGGSRWHDDVTPILVNIHVMFTESGTGDSRKYTGEVKYELYQPSTVEK